MVHLREQKKLKEIHMTRNNPNFFVSPTFDFNPEDVFDKSILIKETVA